MSIQFNTPTNGSAIIKVIGVGGGGSNAVNHMHKCGIVGVDFIICNTDAQALEQSGIPAQVQLGPGLTDGRGAGSKPEVGRNATIESLDEIKQALGSHTKMVFITAGMGGGTGTGGAPIVAKTAREMGILTVGIVTSPFSFEGRRRIMQAQKGVEEMKESVDTLIVISNDKLRELHGNLTLTNAFERADDILTTAAKGIAEIITVPGYVNVDFEDVSTVMRNSGVAIMGTGVADGEDRAMKAVKSALASPLLNDNDIRGAKHILLNITSGSKEVLMDEVGDITNYIQEAAGYTSDVIWGNCIDEALEDKLSVTVIATGFESSADKAFDADRVVLSLDDKPRRYQRREQERNTSHRRYQRPNRQQAPEEQRERVVFNFDDDVLPQGPRYEDDFEQERDQRRGRDPERDRDRDRDRFYNTSSRRTNRQPYEHEDVPPPRYRNEPNPKMNNPRNETSQFGRGDWQEEDRMRVFMERRKRLRGLSMKLQSKDLNDLENEPAYKRRNISLDDVAHSNDSNVSKYSLFEEEERKPEIKRRNPFLHDNVD